MNLKDGLLSIWTDAVQLDSWDNLRYLAAVPWLQWFGVTLNNGISIDIHKAKVGTYISDA